MSTRSLECWRRAAELVRSAKWLHRAMPQWLGRTLRRRFRNVDYLLYLAHHEERALGLPLASDYEPLYPHLLGIIRDPLHYHVHYVDACRELGVAYKVVDLFDSEWVRQFRESACAAFLAWPTEFISEWKTMYDERLRFLSSDLGKVIYPPYEALWLYGSKRRTRDWLDVHGFPHAPTRVFYEEADALRFVTSAQLPLVAKLDIGSCASGVWILESKEKARKLVQRAFHRGIAGRRADPMTRQWRHLLLQDFIAGVREWRMIRIGESYFGHEKIKAGQFHSGSGKGGWFTPPVKALELLHEVTEAGHFRSMDMDVLEAPDGRLFVNELQAVFGAYDTAQMYVNGVPGRYRRVGERFVFEEGHYCRNACCNLRVQDLLTSLQQASGDGRSGGRGSEGD